MNDSRNLSDHEIRKRFTETPKDKVGHVVDLNDGKYLIESIIGEGQQKVVFNAVHQKTGKSVALQLFKSDFDPRSSYSDMMKDAFENLNTSLMARASRIFLEYFPDNDIAAFNIGMAYWIEKRIDLADRAFTYALSLSPDDVTTLFYLALCRADAGKDAEALQLMVRAHAANPAELAQYARKRSEKFDTLHAAIGRMRHTAQGREIYEQYCSEAALTKAPVPAPTAEDDAAPAPSQLPDIRDIAPLLSRDRRISASEFDTDAKYCAHYDLGVLLAFVHSTGIVHGDFKPSNALFNGRTGRFLLIDFATVEQHEISTRYMMADIIVAYGTYGEHEFDALIAGYIKGILWHLEPRASGFLEEFLELLGGEIVNVPINRGMLALLDLLRAGTSVTVNGKTARVTPAAGFLPADLSAGELIDLLLFLCVSRCCGITSAGFEPFLAAAASKHAHLQGAVRLLRSREDFLDPWTERDRDPPLNVCLQLIATARDENRTPGEMKANLTLLRLAVLISDYASFSDARTVAPRDLADKIIVALLHICQATGPNRHDVEWSEYHSASEFIQIGDMIQQKTSRDPRSDEARHCTLQRQKMSIPWFREIIKPGKPKLSGSLDYALLNSDATTASALFRSAVVTEGSAEKRLWSAAFEAKDKLRNILLSMHEALKDRKATGSAWKSWIGGNDRFALTDDEKTITPVIINNYRNLILEMLKSSVHYPAYVSSWTLKPAKGVEGTMTEEVDWLIKAANEVKSITDSRRMAELLGGLEQFRVR